MQTNSGPLWVVHIKELLVINKLSHIIALRKFEDNNNLFQSLVNFDDLID